MRMSTSTASAAFGTSERSPARSELKNENGLDVARKLLDENLIDPAERFLSRSGKRIRDGLVQFAYRIAGGKGIVPECLSEAVEWLHAGSLVIDDIQDDSHERRGHPALHREMGLPLALNAGNWMYFRALEQLTSSDLNPRLQRQALRKLIVTARKCHEGQAIDLAARVDQLSPGAFDATVRQISTLKTGHLVAMSTAFGAIASNASKILRRAITRFGMQIGTALQMRNDLIELQKIVAHSESEKLLRFDDLRHRRVTWAWNWACANSTDRQMDRWLTTVRKPHMERSAAVRLATELLESIGDTGDQAIQKRIEKQLRLLGEHVVDSCLLPELQKILHPILNKSV